MPNRLKISKLQLASVVLVVLAVVAAVHLASQPKLADVEAALKSDYPEIEHIGGSQLTEIDPQQLVFFDVREPEEYGVSHLAGAVHVDPATDPQQFLEDHGELMTGKHVVFYCSVGQRSSAFLSRLGQAPQQLGAQSSANLIGGVFGWVNSGRTLEAMSGKQTTSVHPYNQSWGRLIDDQSKVSYKAGN